MEFYKKLTLTIGETPLGSKLNHDQVLRPIIAPNNLEAHCSSLTIHIFKALLVSGNNFFVFPGTII